jgi:hypothetical protein
MAAETPSYQNAPGYGWTVKQGETTPLVLLEEGLGLTSKDPEESNEVISLAKLNESPNVILLYRLQTLRTMSDTNFVLAIVALAYVGVNAVLWLVLIIGYQLANYLYHV